MLRIIFACSCECCFTPCRWPRRPVFLVDVTLVYFLRPVVTKHILSVISSFQGCPSNIYIVPSKHIFCLWWWPQFLFNTCSHIKMPQGLPLFPLPLFFCDIHFSSHNLLLYIGNYMLPVSTWQFVLLHFSVCFDKREMQVVSLRKLSSRNTILGNVTMCSASQGASFDLPIQMLCF